MTDQRLEIYGGVDTHLDVHMAAAIDQHGRLLVGTQGPTSLGILTDTRDLGVPKAPTVQSVGALIHSLVGLDPDELLPS